MLICCRWLGSSANKTTKQNVDSDDLLSVLGALFSPNYFYFSRVTKPCRHNAPLPSPSSTSTYASDVATQCCSAVKKTRDSPFMSCYRLL